MSSINNDISQLKKIILDTAIRGKLVPQDENDEDAGMLLEKIKAEKEKLIKEGKIKKGKPLPEIKPEEIPFEIPKSWRWVRLSDIGKIVGGGTPDSSNNSYYTNEGGIPWFTPKDLTGYKKMFIEKGNKNISELGFKKSSTQIIPPGTILFSSRAPIGYLAITTKEATTNQGFKSIVPYEIRTNQFFYFVLMGLRKKIAQNAPGTTFKEVSGAIVEKIMVPLPPLSEQQRIVAKIESLFKLADEIDSRRISLVEKVKQLKSAILQEAITGKLVPQDKNDEDAGILLGKIKAEKEKLIKDGKIKKDKPLPDIKPEEIPFEIPKSWKWVRFIDVFDVRDGTHDTPKYTEEGYPLITSKNLINGRLSLENVKNISEVDYLKIIQRSKVNKGDLLFAMIGTIGNPVIVEVADDFAIKNVALFKRIIDDQFLIKFLYYFLLDQVNEMKSKSAGGVQAFVSLGFLRSYCFPLPPIAEQKRIVVKTNGLLTHIDLLEQKLNKSKELASKLNEAVLNETLESKIHILTE